jgi:predicted MPP superfamily phosphohydrolase
MQSCGGNARGNARSSFSDADGQEAHLIVSGGLGDHSIPLRIFNPHEIVCIDVV